MDNREEVKRHSNRTVLEDLCKGLHDYRLDNLYFDTYGDKIIIYSPNWWTYEDEFHSYFFPVTDDEWIKRYGVTNIKFQFKFMGRHFIIKDWHDRVVNDLNKMQLAPLWHPLNSNYYPPAKTKVWLWADDGKGLAEAEFNYNLQKFLFGKDDITGYQEGRNFTHWQELNTPK